MSVSIENITSTRAKVNVEKAAKVFRKYALQGIEFLIDHQGVLTAVGVDSEDVVARYPLAVPVRRLPTEKEYPDEGDRLAERETVFEEEGDAGFIALLKDLAGCLQTPLMILAVMEEDGWRSSQVWRVEPGSRQVETLTTSMPERLRMTDY